jgi:hypothetical protein
MANDANLGDATHNNSSQGASHHSYTPELAQKEKCGIAHGPLNNAGIGHSLTD